MDRAVPILPTDDLEVARRFYVDGLGFSVTFDASQAGLLGVKRGGIALTLDCPMDGHGRHAAVAIEVSDADAYYAEWSARVPVLVRFHSWRGGRWVEASRSAPRSRARATPRQRS